MNAVIELLSSISLRKALIRGFIIGSIASLFIRDHVKRGRFIHLLHGTNIKKSFNI
jgi:hypothetical protein